MARYRWTGSHAYRDHREGRVIEPGDTFASERIATAHPTDCEALDADDTDDEDVAAPVDPGDYTVSELREHLGDADYTAAELDALAAAERDREDGPRSTALEAIDAARSG